MKVRRTIFFPLFLAFLSTLCFAQTTITVRGSVKDATGGDVVGASILVKDQQGNLLTQTVSDGSGNFAIQVSKIADVLLEIPTYAGLAGQSRSIHVGKSLSGIRFTLMPDSVQQQVSVDSSQQASVDPSNNQDAIATSAEDLRKLPVFDQDYVAALTPFLDASAGSSGGATIVVDGIEMKSSGVSASAIQEVRVNNDPYSAEFSRPGRGRIEIITKPGSSQFHGEANFTVRDAVLNARNYFALVRPPETRRIYEGHLSGPLGRGGHTSFIASGSFRQQNTAAVVNAIGPGGVVQGNVLTPNRSGQVSLRLTHDLSESHRLAVGYMFRTNRSENAGVGGITLPEAGYNLYSREDDLLINDRMILSSNLINQLMVMIEKDEDVTQSVSNAQSVQVSGSFVGGGAQADMARTENTIHVNEIMTWSHGRHYIRAGVQLPQFSRRAVNDHTNRLGTFKYSSLASYNAQTPYVFTSQQGIGRTVYWINEFGSFIQDQIKVTNEVQLTLGLRYDWQTFLDDRNNFAPRVTLAYAPTNSNRVYRMGAGLFFDKTGGDFPATVKLHDGVILRTVQVQNPGGNNSMVPGNLPSNIARFSANIKTPYAFQYSAGVEQGIFKTATISVGYRGQVQVKSFRSRDANAPVLPVNPNLGTNYPRPDLTVGQIQQIESGGRTLINALDVAFRGHVGAWFTGQAQYTFSRFMGNITGINGFPQNQYRPNDEWGRSDQDRRQRMNLMGTIHPDHWLSLGVQATLYSGAPYNETTGDDYFHTGFGNARPTGIGRNSLQGGGVASLDLLYGHDFRVGRSKGDNAKFLSLGVSAFNVLNRTNYTSYIGSQSSSRFQQPTAALAARQIQFSAGYRF